MLRIWVLDVGHGDSIVLQYDGPSGPAYGVIDSNRESMSVDPPALKLLQSMGAKSLSFVMLTHPHADHFRGLALILNSFSVHTFYSYPMYMDFERLKEAGKKYLDAAQKCSSDTIRQQAIEFVRLILVAETKRRAGMDWIDLEGATSRVRPTGFDGVVINAMLPFKKVKGQYFSALDANKVEAVESPLQNELSIALEIVYGGHRVALCGDATKGAWSDHRRELAKSKERVSFSMAKLPHHGSATDCDDSVLDGLYEKAVTSGPLRIGLISAPGNRHHPSPAVLKSLEARQIKPYCTNLSVACGNNVRPLATSATIAPAVVKFLNVAGSGTRTSVTRQPCQGNICVSIPSSGAVTIDRQFNNGCAYRGDFDFR